MRCLYLALFTYLVYSLGFIYLYSLVYSISASALYEFQRLEIMYISTSYKLVAVQLTVNTF